MKTISNFHKAIISLLFILINAVLASCSQEPVPIAVTSLTLNSTAITLVEGDSQTLIATVLPSNADNQTVSWRSSNSSVATVNNGVVTALMPGIAVISAKSADGGKTANCKVTVQAKVIPVTGVTLDMTSCEMTEGSDFTLRATIHPENATNKNVTWSSSETEVAVVNEDGKITALKPGKTVITVTTEDGEHTATCQVTVSEKVYPVDDVILDITSYEMTEGEDFTLNATIYPDNATNKNVTWSSSDTEVAVVDENGKVTALSPGKATITVTSEDGGHTATCSVSVKAKYCPVTGIALDQTALEITEGDEVTLAATIYPDNATNKNVTWSSSDTEVAVVDKNGKVTALKPGQAQITATSEDSGQTATCEVTVKIRIYPVEDISLSQNTANMLVGDEMQLEATIYPSNATNQNVTWSSSDPSVATVDNGYVKAHQLGSATITVTTEDGNKSASCVISVVTIDSMVKASFRSVDVTSGSLSFEGSYIKLTSGVKLSVVLNNSSSENITLTGLALICGKNGSRINYSIGEEEIPKETGIGYTITLRYTIYAPIVEFTYRYGSETYTAIAQYNGSF